MLGFLNTLITDAARGGRALTAEELLQRSEALIGPELESDAEVHAMVLSMISASMQTLGNSAEAIRLSDRALGLVSGSQRPGCSRCRCDHARARGGLDWPLFRGAQRARNACSSRPGVAAGAPHRGAPLLGDAGQCEQGRRGGTAPCRGCACRACAASVGPRANLKRRSSLRLGRPIACRDAMAEADQHFAAAYARQQELGVGRVRPCSDSAQQLGRNQRARR